MHQVNTISPITLSTLLAVLTFGYAHTSLAEEVLKDHAYPDPPTWVQDAVAYEVNIRQYTPEGTFNAFRPELKRLQEMGVDVLWIMPIHPIGEKARSGQLGSYYAVRDYKAVNPEFGSPEDFKALVDEAHKLGMYVILDWVANHTAPDHPWVDAHPEWYTRDDAGNLVPPVPEWADVVDLDFAQRPLWDAMIDAMAHWVHEYGVDGFRCDTAEWQPIEFWIKARNKLRGIKPVFMLAEGVDPQLFDYAFDAAYGWDMTPNLHAIWNGTKNASDYANYLRAERRIIGQSSSFRLNYTSHHDLNSWEGPSIQLLGELLPAATVLTYTIEGMPLIYSGQEAGNHRSIAFFDRDTIDWVDHPMADLYTRLSELKRDNPAIYTGQAGGPLRILEEDSSESVLAFERRRDEHRIVVIINLVGRPQEINKPIQTSGLNAVIASEGVEVFAERIKLPGWGFQVWSTSRR